jgi:hypothetical protein
MIRIEPVMGCLNRDDRAGGLGSIALRRARALLACAVVLPSWAFAQARPPDDRAGIDLFESKIRPVLVQRCYRCHSSHVKNPKGGLRLDTRAGMRAGGNSGPAVVPGDLESSLLFQALTGQEEVEPMPPDGKLPAAAIADFRRWIKLGAPDPRVRGAESVASASRAGNAGRWWSLQPLVYPAVPRVDPRLAGWVRTPIDAFILAKLGEKGFEPGPEADRPTLIRRLTFDLTGLPPSPAAVADFVGDPAADAYERLVDRLLESPHHGERWARLWMDLVHYAETHGHDQDRIRPSAWPYRDYLIRSFNEDKPYARFAAEQVAADALFPVEPALAIALGMLAAGPWDESSLRDIRDDSIDRQIGYYIDRDDMVSTVMSTFVSTTIHCARCHDHKFDPITQEDYYSLQSVFAGVDKAERGYDRLPALDRLRRRLAAALKQTEGRNAADGAWLQAEVAALPPQSLVFAAASDFLPDAGHKPPGGPRPVYVLARGDIHSPGKPAAPGALTCVAGLQSRFPVSPDDPESARRAFLARWIVDPRNPLTWRSICNRVWQSHFGRGLVATPNDFGRMGAPPSHPELLDWMASTFLASGGSLKPLHRLIVTSAVYRQSAQDQPAFRARDAENQWLWKQNRRRLDAESVHDAILEVAGNLDRAMGGPSVRHFTLSPGVHVTPVVDYTQYDWAARGSCRRSVYRFVFRTLPDPFYDALDAADASQLTATRSESTTPLQALELLNNPFVLRQCAAFAERLRRHGPCLEEQLQLAFLLAYCRAPTSAEVDLLSAYAAAHGLPNLCRVLFNSNEFLFVN